MRPKPDLAGSGQESVWAFPRPAIAQPSAAHITISHAGKVIADTRARIRTIETSHPPSYYIPPGDIAPGVLRITSGSSFCEWKGVATYWDAIIDSVVLHRVGWSYPDPSPSFRMLRDHVAFYAGPFDFCSVDGKTGHIDTFDLKPFDLGEDEDGDPIEDLYVVPTNGPGVVTVPRERRERPLPRAAQVYLDAYGVVFADAVEVTPFGSEGPRLKAVDRTKVRTEFYARYPADGDTSEKQAQAKRKAFGNGEKALSEKRKIATRELNGVTYVWTV